MNFISNIQIQNLRNSQFTKNVIITSGGVLIGFAGNFILQPIITRLYTPEMIGIVSLLVAIVSLLSITSSFSYDMAILRSESSNEAYKLGFISLITLVFFCIVLAIILGLWFDEIFNNTKYFILKSYWIFIPIFILLKKSNKILQDLFVRLKEYSKNSIAEILKTLSPPSFKIILGYSITANSLLLLISTLLGMIVNGLYLFISQKETITRIFKGKDLDLRETLVKYKKYPLIFNWNNVLNALAQQSTILLLAVFYETADLGYYSLAVTIIFLPVGFISNSVFKVFLPTITEKWKKKQSFFNEYKKVLIIQFAIGIVIFSLLFVIAPWLFKIVFSETWEKSGIFVQLLCPWLVMMFINKPANAVIQLFEKFKFLTIYNLFILLFRVIAILIGYYLFENIFWSIGLFSFVGIIGNIVFISYATIVLKLQDAENNN